MLYAVHTSFMLASTWSEEVNDAVVKASRASDTYT